MKAEIVPVQIDTEGSGYPLASLPWVQGARVVPYDEDTMIILGSQEPHLVYMSEDEVYLLAGNIKVTWTVTEWFALQPRMEALINSGRENTKFIDGIKDS